MSQFGRTCKNRQRIPPGRAPNGDPKSQPPSRPLRVMASPNFRLEDLAYAKIILHALKYPHQTVNGVLLGSPPSSGCVTIVDTVPLQHHWTNLSPMMEVGLGMVRSVVSPILFFLLRRLSQRLSCILCGRRPPIMPIVVVFKWLGTTRRQSALATQRYPLPASASRPR